MRLLLTTLNSKFSHMALGIRYMRGILKGFDEIEMDFKEFTINQQMDYILSEIYNGTYDVVLMSVYIWNLEASLTLIKNLKQINPNVRIAVGGPEVSYDTRRLMEDCTEIDFVLMGEGELILQQWIHQVLSGGAMQDVLGLAYRKGSEVVINPPMPLIQDLNQIPFPYDASDDFENRLVYYESQRGCPYNCAYCMSSTFKGVRFFDVERVVRDLKWFVDKEVQIVKFVDRTFNIRKEHFLAIMQALHQMDKGVTSFHFEITASLLDEETLDFLKDVRKGLFQFEIGVQSTHVETLKAIHRHHNLEKLKHHVHTLKSYGNIHLHLDLIAGLPYENYERFMTSFDDVYQMHPDVIQLGFLKLLKGSELRSKEELYGFKYRSYPPYEVLETHVMSFGDLDQLKKMEDLLDKYYNSKRFKMTLAYIETLFETPHALFTWLNEQWQKEGYFDMPTSLPNLYRRLFDHVMTLPGSNEIILGNALKYDMLSQKLMKVEAVLPEFHHPLKKEYGHELLKDESFRSHYLQHFGELPAKQIIKRVHFEVFELNDGLMAVTLFDYEIDQVSQVDPKHLAMFEM